MRSLLLVISLAAFCHGVVRAEVSPVSISAPESTAWTGERIRILVELRANGSFSGRASFDVPEIHGTLLIKVGNPVVSSKEIEGESWFVQTHEFALFSQKTGKVTIPPFPVRFGSRDGFTGPVTETGVNTEAVSIEIQRPPGSEGVPFLVTTTEFSVEETWDPVPEGKAKVGDVFRRTIVQRADGLTGMALLPTSILAPEGVRVYPPQVETKDNTQRGAFEGERRETLTYLLQKDGTIVLPGLTYAWWDPKSEALKSKTLPAVTMEVAPARVAVTGGSDTTRHRWWPGLLVAGLAVVCLWQRRRIVIAFRRFRLFLNPPAKVAARKLRKACRRSDAVAAQVAWSHWLAAAGRDVEIDSGMRSAIVEMQRINFGDELQGDWDGTTLLLAFKAYTSTMKKGSTSSVNFSLPTLNNPSLHSK